MKKIEKQNEVSKTTKKYREKGLLYEFSSGNQVDGLPLALHFTLESIDPEVRSEESSSLKGNTYRRYSCKTMRILVQLAGD